MVSIKNLVWLRAAALVLPLAILPAGAARAQATLNMTERSSTDLDVALSIGGYVLNETETGPGDAWDVGGEFGPLPLFAPSNGNHSLEIYAIAWIEPGGSMDTLETDTFNVLLFSPSGNHGTTNLVIFSDESYGLFLNQSFHECDTPGVFFACPILMDGQSIDVPFVMSRPTPQDNLVGTLTVTFNDRGDVEDGVPEPAAWTLMIAGFGLAGASLRRRRAAPAGGH